MTPSHVVGLWTNVNSCLIAVAKHASSDPALSERLVGMTPIEAEGKKPKDVLGLVAAFRGKLDRLRSGSRLGATEIYQTEGQAITPSHVFLNSGHVLNGLVEWLIANSPRDQLVSQYYRRHELSGKTPSHAFAQVDLANRRLDAILAQSGK